MIISRNLNEIVFIPSHAFHCRLSIILLIQKIYLSQLCSSLYKKKWTIQFWAMNRAMNWPVFVLLFGLLSPSTFLVQKWSRVCSPLIDLTFLNKRIISFNLFNLITFQWNIYLVTKLFNFQKTIIKIWSFNIYLIHRKLNKQWKNNVLNLYLFCIENGEIMCSKLIIQNNICFDIMLFMA